MHSCDYKAGAWFKSADNQENHAFYDPETNQFHRFTGPENPMKLLSVVNSKRGYYFTAIFDTLSNQLNIGYSNPETFWSQRSEGRLTLSGRLDLQFISMNASNNDNRTFFVGVGKK